MNRLSPREERIMRVLWKLGEGFVKDVIAELPKPQPPYNTVSSIIRILEEKGYVGHRAFGRTHQYFPIVSQNEFRSRSLKNLLKEYFGGSVETVVSQMVREEELSEGEIQKIREVIDAAEQQKGVHDE